MSRESGGHGGRRNENHVKYKFKSALEYSTVSFSGSYISVADLRRQIIQDNRLVQNPDYMLQITNQDTKHVYDDSEQTLIPANTHLTILRIPIAEPTAAEIVEIPKKRKIEEVYQNLDNWAGAKSQAKWTNANYNYEYEQGFTYADYGSYNYGEGYYNTDYNAGYVAQGQPSAAHYNVTNSNLRAIPRTSFSDKNADFPPPTYRCYKCNNHGHWIRNCPLNTLNDYATFDPSELRPSPSNLVQIPAASTGTRPILSRNRSISTTEQTESVTHTVPSESQPEADTPESSPHLVPPSTYRCYVCNIQGHWIRDCPVKKQIIQEAGYLPTRTTGIPRSSLVIVDDANFKGAMLTPEGRYAVPAVDLAAYRSEKLANP